MVATSTPAAPQVLTGFVFESQQRASFWLASSGWAATFARLFAGYAFFPEGDPEQEEQSARDARVTRIEVYPGDVMLRVGESATFAAVAYGTSDTGEEITVSGVNFTWLAQDADGQGVAVSAEGLFEASSAGVFTISVEGVGHQAQVTVTVLENEQSGTPQGETSIGIGGEVAVNGGLRWWRDDLDNQHGNAPGAGEGNGNFQLAAPVLGLPGRGIGLSLSLVYNSQLWSKSGSTIIFDADQGWPAPGWSLGFGKLVGLGVNVGSILVDADGTRHSFRGEITPLVVGQNQIGTKFVGHTTDGTFIDYEYTTGTNGFLNYAQAKLPNGTVIRYDSFGPLTHDLYPTQITDANGNFIIITYVPVSEGGLGGEIKTVTDTLGRIIKFNYDTGGRLIEVTAPGLNAGDPMRSLVRLHYKPLTLQYSFSGLSVKGNASNNGVVPTTISVIDAIYYPATRTGYWFGDTDSYSSYGMIKKVSERRGMSMTTPANSQGSINQDGCYPNCTDDDEYGSDAPIADPGGPYSGQVGHRITVNGSGSSDDGVINRYLWNFGDGTTGEGEYQEHIYTQAARYTVRLTVWDDEGQKDFKTTYAVISSDGTPSPSPSPSPSPPPPSPSPTASPSPPPPPTTTPPSAGVMTSESVYAYQTSGTLTKAPTFQTVSQKWAGMKGTNPPPAVTTYEVTENSTERIMTITGPKDDNGWQIKSVQHSIKHPDHFDHGLVNQDETYEVNGASQNLLQKSLVYWEEGAYESPRAKSIEVTDELGQLTKTDFDFGLPEEQKFNQVRETRNYDYGGTSLVRVTVTDYENSSNYLNRHIFNLVKSVEIWSANGTTKSTRQSLMEYHYDSVALTDTPGVIQHSGAYNSSSTTTKYRGNVTKVTRYANAAQRTDPIIESRGYDITGNLVTLNTACCERTTYTYTSATHYAYPSTITRGASTAANRQVTTSATYSVNTGLALSTTDANGFITKTKYIPTSLRVDTVTAPTNATTTYTYDDAAMKVTEVTKTDTGVIASKNVKNLNGLGQVIKEEAFAGGIDWDFVDTEYDNLGRITRQTRPYRSGDPPQWSETTYDATGRPIRSKAPDGSETKAFYNELKTSWPSAATNAPGNSTRIVDAWGRERWGKTDVFGRLVEVVEPKPDGNGTVSAEGLLTEYDYDTLGNLTLVDQQAQARIFEYDSLGRLMRQKLAETSATLNESGVYGGQGARWSDVFTYDERSNLTSRTDARGVKTIYDYNDDPLNRLQSVTYDLSGLHEQAYPILPSPKVTYTYMTTGDITQLQKVITEGVSTEIYGYDSQRRLDEKTLKVELNGSTFDTVTSYVYDSLGRVQDMYYPAKTAGAVRKQVHYDYDESSRLKNLKVDNVSYASAITYNASSQALTLNVGASVKESYEYELATGLLKNQKVSHGESILMNLSYDYLRAGTTTGRTGQLTKITNHKRNDGKTDRAYEYDKLGRLIKATGGQSLWTQSYTYDRYGNRKTVIATGSVAGFVEPTASAPQAPDEELEQTTNPETPDPSGGSGNNQNSSSPPPSPGSTFFDVPSLIQAEDFGNGGAGGESYADGTTANMGSAQYRPETGVDIVSNNGGYYVGFTETGEYLNYPLNVAVSDTYNIEAQVANSTDGGSFHIEISRVGNTDPAQVYHTGALAVPATGGEMAFQAVSKTGVQLSAGRYMMRVVMDSVSSAGVTANFDHFKLVPTTPSTHRTPFDFDGDGKTDVATYKPATGAIDPNWAILNSSTNEAKGERNLGDSSQYQALPEDQDRPAPSDYDGDGKTDTAVWAPSTGNWLIKSSAGNPVLRTQQWGMSGDLPVPADYDGDGKADIAVWRPSNGSWYIQQSSNGAIAAPGLGSEDDLTVQADYDGDGKTDVAVWRPSNGTWYIQQSTDGAVRSSQWGADGDVPVPGDYDGDDKTDLAVWRPGDGVWYILRSSDGTTWGPQWGNSTDIPTQGDFNGDGVADVAVFRPNPATGDWYVLETMGGTVIQSQLGDETMIPVGAAYQNKPPVARPGGPYTAMTNQNIQFDGSLSSDDTGIKEYKWDFGDGQTGLGKRPPLHHYATAGTYTVKLTVKDKGGLSRTGTTKAFINDPIPVDGLTGISYDTLTNRISTAGFEYDAAGNQTRIKRTDDSWQRMEYDAAGRLVKVKKDNGTVIQSVTYGSSNQRLMVEEITDTSTSRTYYGWSGGAVIAEYNTTGVAVTTPQWAKSYIYLGGRLLATLTSQPTGNSETVQYNHPDRLGTRLVTNNSGTSAVEQVTLPYGTALDGESSPPGSTTRRFTSYDRSGQTGLDYAVNRHYDSQQGRFTQVDPIGIGAASLSNPQSFNMYAYCGNDPINHIDPNGLFFGWLKKLFRGIANVFQAVVKVVARVLANKWVQVAIGVVILILASPFAPVFFSSLGASEAVISYKVASILQAATAAVGSVSNFLLNEQTKQKKLHPTVERAILNVKAILSIKDGACAKFFGPNALRALENLGPKLADPKNIGPIRDQNKRFSKTIGIRQSGDDSILQEATGQKYGREFEDVMINNQGPFFNQGAPSRPGGYEPGKDRAQAFQILHELAHVTAKDGAYVIENDVDEKAVVDNEKSEANSKIIKQHCQADLERTVPDK